MPATRTKLSLRLYRGQMVLYNKPDTPHCRSASTGHCDVQVSKTYVGCAKSPHKDKELVQCSVTRTKKTLIVPPISEVQLKNGLSS